MESTSQLDPFFFPSSPIFSSHHQQHMHQQQSQQQHQRDMMMMISNEEDAMMLAPTGASSLQTDCMNGGMQPFIEQDLLFAPQHNLNLMQQEKLHLQQPISGTCQYHQMESTDEFGLIERPAEFDWNRAVNDTATILSQSSGDLSPSLSHSDSSSSVSVSEASSGHTTPTMVASPNPTLQQQQQQQAELLQQQQLVFSVEQQQQQLLLQQQNALRSMQAQQMNIVVAPQQQQSIHAPSLLEQFKVTIPTIPSPQARPLVKAKRGARRAPEPTTSATLEVPVSVSSSSSKKKQQQLVTPSRGNSGGYASDSSHPSVHSTPSPTHKPAAQVKAETATRTAAAASAAMADDEYENNEPSVDDDESTKRRKLLRKAELARLARKRKKTRLGDLEAEVARLEEELERVKRTRMIAPESAVNAEIATEQKMTRAVEHMISAVHAGLTRSTTPSPRSNTSTPTLTGSDAVSRSSPTQLTPLIDEFMCAYNQTQQSCAKHLEALEKHIKPPKTFEFLAWLMKQPHESVSSIWSSLLQRELLLPPDSREYREFECFRTSIGAQHNFDLEVERTFIKMTGLLHKRATQHAKNLNRIRSILDEKQFLRFVKWSHTANTSAPASPLAAAASSL